MSENLPMIPVLDQQGREVVRPDVVQMVTQLSQLAQLTRLRRLEESKIPSHTETFEHTVSDEDFTLYLSPPWISVSVVNRGADAVHIEVNSGGRIPVKADIPADEDFEYNAVYANIISITFRAEAGGSAQLDVKGKVGRVSPSGPTEGPFVKEEAPVRGEFAPEERATPEEKLIIDTVVQGDRLVPQTPRPSGNGLVPEKLRVIEGKYTVKE